MLASEQSSQLRKKPGGTHLQCLTSDFRELLTHLLHPLLRIDSRPMKPQVLDIGEGQVVAL